MTRNNTAAAIIAVMLTLSIVIPAAASLATATEDNRIYYYHETFENATKSTVVYQQKFEIGPGSWSGGSWDSNDLWYQGSNYDRYQGRATETHSRSITINAGNGTYGFYIRGRADESGGDVDDDWIELNGQSKSLENPPDDKEWDWNGLSVSLRNGSSYTLHHKTTGNGYDNRIYAYTDRVLLVKGVSSSVAGYNSLDAPLFVTDEWDGKALNGNIFRQRINASGAEQYNSVGFSVTFRAYEEPINYEITQSGYTIVSGTIDPGQKKTIDKRISLESEKFYFTVESEGRVTMDNVAVYRSSTSSTSDGPTGPMDYWLPSSLEGSLNAQQGFFSTLSIITNIWSLQIDTLMGLGLILITLGVVVYFSTRNTSRAELGRTMLLGGGVLVLSIMLLPLVFDTLGFIVTGTAGHAPLQGPNLEAEPPIYYAGTFERDSFADTRWEIVNGTEQEIFLVGSGNNNKALQLNGHNTTIEADVEIPIANKLDSGYLKLDVYIESSRTQNTPDRDALNATVLVNGNTTQINDTMVAMAEGGQVTDKAVTRPFELDGKKVTVRLSIKDLNLNADSTITVEIDNVKVGAGPEGN